ncbi:MAG: thymidine phosphorylase [Kiritimatiellae bacterium]|nr:thymidine phosphorylase [Kiritimatiellia bacterium]
MIVKLLLDRKREGGALTAEEIHALIDAYTKGDVPDYQMASFAMAVCCRGMNDAETLALTEAMRDSGTCLSWPGFPPTADKHSTGGVGDKLSLIIQPLAAACGLAVPSLTGRGLGLTGGTADKMESIPGYVAGLTLDQYRPVVSACGCSLTVQTGEIAPADKKLYALRDVTGTVPSIPLIVASILSKKLAEGAETLVFDVKCGAGAFMKTPSDARALAHALVKGAHGAGRKACALVTQMDEPLGFAVGNANEVQESIDVLQGRSRAQDVIDLSIAFAARMVSLAKGLPIAEARAQCQANLANGAAFARFAQMVKLHGGDLAAFDTLIHTPVATYEVKAAADGFVASIDANGIAQAAFELGAGRAKSDDMIDPLAGVNLCVTRGDAVKAGETLARLATTTRSDVFETVSARVQAAIRLTPDAPSPKQLIFDVIEN